MITTTKPAVTKPVTATNPIAPASTTKWRYAHLAYGVVIACWVTYALLTFLSPQATNQRFNLNAVQTTVLRLTIALPVLFIWFTAINGALSFKRYASLISGSPEAKGINLIANGLLWTVGYLILISILGSLIPYFASTSLALLVVGLRNNLPGIAALIAFVLMYQGSSELKRVANFTTWTKATPWIFLIYSIFAAALTIAFYYSPTNTLNSSGLPAYALSPDLLLFTLILPSLIAWFMGILASINLLKYARRVRGVIYQRALRDLVRGIWGIIFFAVLLQAFYMINPVLQKASLGAILLCLYGLLIAYGLGFMFVKSGAKKLTHIEVAQ